jgi:hypothetical protein
MVSSILVSTTAPELMRYTDDLKDVIQHLFEIQSAVHGYLGPETQQELVRKMYVSYNGTRPISTTSIPPNRNQNQSITHIPRPNPVPRLPTPNQLLIKELTNNPTQQKPHPSPLNPFNTHPTPPKYRNPTGPNDRPLKPTLSKHPTPTRNNRLRRLSAQPGYLHSRIRRARSARQSGSAREA